MSIDFFKKLLFSKNGEIFVPLTRGNKLKFKKTLTLLFFFSNFLFLSSLQAATLSQEELVVWVNEAIVATYTFDFQHFLEQQKTIAKYFTAPGWTSYSKALLESKLPEAIQKNSYFVSAVPTLPPTIKTINSTQWQATVPLLVLYKNPQYAQKQNLEINVTFMLAPRGEGVRGLAITSLQSKLTTPPCQCNSVQKSMNETTESTPPQHVNQ